MLFDYNYIDYIDYYRCCFFSFNPMFDGRIFLVLWMEKSHIFLLQEKRERPLWQRMLARLLVKGSLSSFPKRMDYIFWWIFGWHTWVFCWKNPCSPHVHHVFFHELRHVNDSCPRAQATQPEFPARFWLIGRQSDEELFIWSALQCTEMLGLKLWPASITAIVTMMMMTMTMMMMMMMMIVYYIIINNNYITCIDWYYIYCYYIITILLRWLVIILIILIICISYFWPWAIMMNVFCLSLFIIGANLGWVLESSHL